jgi:hypothetical protein
MIDFYKGIADADTTHSAEPKIERMKCTTTGDYATCTYLSDGKEQKMELIKKDNKWMVNMPKENNLPPEIKASDYSD